MSMTWKTTSLALILCALAVAASFQCPGQAVEYQAFLGGGADIPGQAAAGIGREIEQTPAVGDILLSGAEKMP